MRAGVVFEIREFALHDGPGIRTTVFFKGCPLRCLWCHNPEGLAREPQLLFNVASCSNCGVCATVCPRNDGAKRIDRAAKRPTAIATNCVACGECAKFCPTRSRRLCGRRLTSDELVAELAPFKAVFGDGENGGGVTFSGGEPLWQPEFLVETAVKLRETGIRTALETSGFAAPEVYRSAVGAVDFVFQDVKHPNDAEHRRLTGVSNRPTLENLAWLKMGKTPFVVRVPLVPTANDAPETLEEIAALLIGAGAAFRGVELLPYHAAGGGKYALLGKAPPAAFPEIPPRSDVLEPFERLGIPARIL